MRVLVVGAGAREHTIVSKLARSPTVGELLVAPGNAGTAGVARNVPIGAEDVEGLLRLAQSEEIGLTVVGPEAPLALGIADRFHDAGLPIFGPTQAAARIETSKSFAKDLMLRHGVPTGAAEAFSDYERAAEYVRGLVAPVVVKADGLTAGKGVTVAETQDAAQEALRLTMAEKRFGAAGYTVLVEEYLEGPELSVFAFVDGKTVSPLVAAQDYKRAYDGDRGPNTGGMGAFSPPVAELWNDDMEDTVRTRIMEPVVNALAAEGCPYTGFLYAGLMVTKDGPKVIEFNCRMGDPEAQVVLPRLKTDLLEVMISAADGDLRGVYLEWDSRACVGVVVASGGYPDKYETGYAVSGLGDVDDDVTVFHAGTRLAANGAVVSNGGRVLTVTALGDTLKDARRKAYSNAGRVRFTGAFYRNDVASRA